MIRYDKKWFNPLFFELKRFESDPDIRIILVYGGKSSSKTISITQLLAQKALSQLKNTIAYRKESTIIKTTLKESFNLALQTSRIGSAFTTLDFSYRCYRGSKIVLKGLDSPEKGKGIESFDYIYLDELNQFTAEEFDQLNLSLRGRPGQKLFATWNPVSSGSWVKKDLVDKIEFIDLEHSLPCKDSFVKISKDGSVVLIKTTYEDNYWIIGSPCGTYGYRDEALIKQYKALEFVNPASYRVNVKGEWGVEDPEKLFIRNFLPRHRGVVEWDKSLDTYLTWDLNYDPRCLVVQRNDGKSRIIREYGSKELTLPYVCAKIRTDFPKAFFTINGDASGHHSRNLTDNATSYKIISESLNLSMAYNFNVPKANPTHRRSRLQCNAMFEFKDVIIDQSCVGLIKDIESCVVDVNGSIDPWKKANPDLSHFIDPLRYHYNAEWQDVFADLHLDSL